MTAIVILTPEDLRAFTRPGLDLQTGQLVELAPPTEPEPVQLDLPLEVIRLRPSRELTLEG